MARQVLLMMGVMPENKGFNPMWNCLVEHGGAEVQLQRRKSLFHTPLWRAWLHTVSSKLSLASAGNGQ